MAGRGEGDPPPNSQSLRPFCPDAPPPSPPPPSSPSPQSLSLYESTRPLNSKTNGTTNRLLHAIRTAEPFSQTALFANRFQPSATRAPEGRKLYREDRA
ncbi:hypothetical protein K0M31_006971 [Melipona bicolor]|uniref:Uncharacterized protein n=1 Tax=Melipona bicolor TaxID=60889 RepID=A0AA40KKS6_9HYME|nr:hypothetical protein K0M31_006971 [Melipona bicolor]